MLELAYRVRRHDHPSPADYRARFAAHPEVIRSAFEAVPTRRPSPGPPAPAASHSGADRNLLFGVLAMQMDFVSREALIAAVSAWVLDKSKPLDRILVEQGALATDERDLLEPLIRKHLERHGGDPGRSLASVGSRGPAREALRHVADPELDASLALLGGLDPTDITTDQPRTDPVRPREPRRPEVPRAPATRQGRAGRGVRRSRRGAAPRSRAEADPGAARRATPAAATRFQFEAEITGRLEHPGVIPVYGLGVDEGGRPYYAMRFVRGESLKEAIERFHREDGPTREAGERSLAFRELLGRFVDVCNTMAYAHGRGILHRDLKPANVMLGQYGETLVVDWGLAKAAGRPAGEPPTGDGSLGPLRASDGGSTEPGSWLGTPSYMSPEQAAGRIDQLGPASDVYSLGATLYNLLTGKLAFDGEDVFTLLGKIRAGDFPPPRSVDPAIDPALESVCLKAMALTPEDRYASCRALADDVKRWAADEPVSACREPPAARLARWATAAPHGCGRPGPVARHRGDPADRVERPGAQRRARNGPGARSRQGGAGSHGGSTATGRRQFPPRPPGGRGLLHHRLRGHPAGRARHAAAPREAPSHGPGVPSSLRQGACQRPGHRGRAGVSHRRYGNIASLTGRHDEVFAHFKAPSKDSKNSPGNIRTAPSINNRWP